MKRLTVGLLLLALGLCATGCGGGGGGGGGGGDDTRLPLTRANAKAVAGGLSGAMHTLDRLAFVNSQLLDAVGGGAPKVAVSTGRTARLLGQAPRAAALLGGEQTFLCGDSGSYTVDVTDTAPLEVFSLRDAVSVTYAGCAAAGITTDGQIDFHVTATDGHFPSHPFDLGLAFSFTGLSATVGAQTTTVDGGFTIQVATPDGISFDTGLTGSRLSAAEAGSGNLSVTLSDFDASTTNDADAYSIAVSNATLAVSASGADGVLAFRTSTPLSGAAGQSPNAGAVVATGRNGSTLTLVVLDDQRVELRVHEDGVADGAPIPATWAELGGL